MSTTSTSATLKPEETRLKSMDAYRGFVMICLAADGFGLARAAKKFPDNSVWQAIGYQFDHVPWVGCAFWDLIQPSFMFLVGVALPYSYARRETSGESSKSLLTHALIRSVILILLGIFLSSTGSPTTNFTFMNVLTQIGLGYTFVFLLRNRGLVIQALVAVAILGLYWGWFAITPAVPIESLEQYKTEYDIRGNWVLLEGFEAHWQKHKNPAAAVDFWLLNLFPAKATVPPADAPKDAHPADEGAQPESPTEKKSPGLFEQVGGCLVRLVTRPKLYKFNGGGYQTLNFVPSIVTMLIGLMAGEFIRRGGISRGRTFGVLLLAGVILLGLGWGWHAAGGCPLVKRIWTPSWTLFSTGWTLVILASFYGVIDVLGWRAWSFPLVVAGMNSMVLYMAGQLLRGWTSDLLKRHVNDDLFQIFGSNYASIVESSLVLLCFWLFVYWLYRQRIFVKI
jgi:predicted acyltransferase